MVIFPAESDIADKIRANCNSNVILPVSFDENQKSSADISANLKKFPTNNDVEKAFAKCMDHPDLMYGSAILASTGMNLNDDIFIPSEMWIARNTCINTPYNDQHSEKDIMGHIYNARVLVDGEMYEDDEVPDRFDIECDFVLYKSIFPDKAFEVDQGAKENKRFVSMEAMMDDFAYGIMKDEETIQIVERNKDTAFLTKYLAIYGGSGKYNDKKIGRVLKSFRFIGMGNVTDPANPKSFYTKINNIEILTADASEELVSTKKEIVYYTKGNKMFKTIEEAIAHIEKLDKELADLKASADALKVELEASKTAQADLTKTNKELASTLDLEKGKVEVATAKIVEKDQAIADLNTKLTATNASLEEKTAKLAEIKANEILASRINDLTTLKIAISDERRKSIASMTDEQFKVFFDWAKEIVKPENKAEANLDNVDDKTAEAEDVNLNTKNEQEELDKAKAELETTANRVISCIFKKNDRNVKKTNK